VHARYDDYFVGESVNEHSDEAKRANI